MAVRLSGATASSTVDGDINMATIEEEDHVVEDGGQDSSSSSSKAANVSPARAWWSYIIHVVRYEQFRISK
jgi:hypothetical protein